MRQQGNAVDDRNISLEAVVFDFDGTLAELVLDFAAMKRLVAEAAKPYLADVPSPNGLPALEYAAELAQAIARSDAAAARRFLADAAGRIQDMELEAAANAQLFPDIRDRLAALAGAGLRIGIITRNCRAAVARIFPDADRFAGVVLTRDDARHVKPDPRHLLDALAVLGARPEHALMVGDHPMDVATGKAAGAQTAGVASGRVSLAELARSEPDYLAEDVAGLVAVLLR